MGDFSDMRYYHQYIAACTSRDRIRRCVEDLRAGLTCVRDEQQLAAAQQKIAEAAAELTAASEEADRLYCLCTFGKSREALHQENTYRPVGLQPKPRFPAPPDFTGRRLH